MTDTTIRLLAPVKVNLFLQVIGKRPDNYHDLFSLMCPISLYDHGAGSLLSRQAVDRFQYGYAGSVYPWWKARVETGKYKAHISIGNLRLKLIL